MTCRDRGRTAGQPIIPANPGARPPVIRKCERLFPTGETEGASLMRSFPTRVVDVCGRSGCLFDGKTVRCHRAGYLAAVMPDFRYQQTTQHSTFTAPPRGRSPAHRSWLARHPERQPAAEDEEAQLLPALCNGETARLEIRPLRTRDPAAAALQRGTLIRRCKMPGALLMTRFCGACGKPRVLARRRPGEIIRGLKKQNFLIVRARTSCPPRWACRCSAFSAGRSGARRSGVTAQRMPARRCGRQAGDGWRN